MVILLSRKNPENGQELLNLTVMVQQHIGLKNCRLIPFMSLEFKHLDLMIRIRYIVIGVIFQAEQTPIIL